MRVRALQFALDSFVEAETEDNHSVALMLIGVSMGELSISAMFSIVKVLWLPTVLRSGVNREGI
jgi:hypothetical protein